MKQCARLCRWSLLFFLCIAVMPAMSAPTYDVEAWHAMSYVKYEGGPVLLDLYRPMGVAGVLPVVLAIHGGFWRDGSREDMRGISELIASQGYAVAAIDHRLLPQCKFPDQLADVRHAAGWIRENAGKYHLDATRLLVLGVSGGGQLAALLGLQQQPDCLRIAGIIDLDGPMDLRVTPPNLVTEATLCQYLGASQQEKPDLYAQASPITYVSKDAPPCLIMHGTADPLVPFAQAQAMTAALRKVGAPVTFYPMQGVGHDISNLATPAGQKILNAIFTFLKQYTTSTSEKSERSGDDPPAK